MPRPVVLAIPKSCRRAPNGGARVPVTVMIRPYVVALLLPFPSVSLAQSGQIVGHTLLSNGSPVVGAHVTLIGTSRSATTSGTGEFTLDDVPPGSYQVRAVRQGLDTSQQLVVVTSGKTSNVLLVLNPTPVLPALISFSEPATLLPDDSLKLPVPDSLILRKRQSEGSIPFTPRAGQRMRLELFSRPGVIVEFDQASESPDGVEATGFIISDAGVRSGLVTVVARQGRVIANIRYGLQLFMIRPQARGVHLIVEVDARKLPGDDLVEGEGPGAR